MAKGENQVSNHRQHFYDEKVGNGYECQVCNGSTLLKELQKEASRRPPDCLNPSTAPFWLDADKLKRGQAVFHRYFLSVIVSNLVGLLCLLSVEGILKALVFTGRSKTQRLAFKRYLNTINHLRRWYSSDVFDPETSAYKSIQLVRRIHVRSHTDAKNALAAFPSQTDMVITQWAFFGLVLTHGEQLGIKCTNEEEEALVHFWKSIGYLMGIEDRYNLAYGGLEEVRRNCHAVVHQFIIPSISRPPSESSSMSDAMLHGVHKIVPVVDPSAFQRFTWQLFNLNQGDVEIRFYSRCILNLMICNFGTALHFPVIGTFLRHFENGLLVFALYVCNLLPSIDLYFTKCKNYVTRIWHGLVKAILHPLKLIGVMLNLQNS